jgi:hypothetical protein
MKTGTPVSYKKQELFIFQELLCSSPVFGGVRVVAYISNTTNRGRKQELLKDK